MRLHLGNHLITGSVTLTENFAKIMELDKQESNTPLFDKVREKHLFDGVTSDGFIDDVCNPIEEHFRNGLKEICNMSDMMEIDADAQLAKIYDLSRKLLNHRL